MNEKLLNIIKGILALAIPAIKKLIESQVVPRLKRRAYEVINTKTDLLIKDLAQNASKIANEPDENKKLAYIEGTKLGVETLRLLAEKLAKASDEIEKVIG